MSYGNDYYENNFARFSDSFYKKCPKSIFTKKNGS
jgi:hypothetical protein